MYFWNHPYFNPVGASVVMLIVQGRRNVKILVGSSLVTMEGSDNLRGSQNIFEKIFQFLGGGFF